MVQIALVICIKILLQSANRWGGLVIEHVHVAAAEHALCVLLLLEPKYGKFCKDKEFGKEGITASRSVMEQLLLALS